jgi:iron complex transport system permease protein
LSREHGETKYIGLTARQVYEQVVRRKGVLLSVLAAALIVAFFTDLMTGPAWLGIGDVVHAIMFPRISPAKTRVIVWVIRMPTALMAVVVGAALAVAGAEMQTILDNPLASPYTLGIASAAGFGAALALVSGVSVFPLLEAVVVPINAFFFAILSSLAVYLVAKLKNGTAGTIVLAGIALSFMFHSLVSLLQYFASENELQAIVFWLFGSLIKATWTKLGITTLVLVLITPWFVANAWKLTALRLGDHKAKSLGMQVDRLRLRVLILSSILTAIAVCFVGSIGFIGLVAPHLSRMLVGEDQRFFLPFSALSGAFLLSAASVVSKLLIQGVIFPIGIITSLVGIPFFLSMIITKKRSYW